MVIENDLSKFKGLYIEIRKDENDNMRGLDFALRKFKRMIKDDELMVRLQEISHFTKPSAIKRDKKNRAKARMQSDMRKKR